MAEALNKEFFPGLVNDSNFNKNFKQNNSINLITNLKFLLILYIVG